MVTENAHEDENASSIPRWLAGIIHNLGVQSIEATFSGSGDNGCMDDLILNLSPEAGMTEVEMSNHLESLKVRLQGGREESFWGLLGDHVTDDAEPLGNYSDGDGGSVWLRIAIEPSGAYLDSSSYTPGEPYEDDEHDDEWDPDF
jgi:hypothetical protein